MRMLMFVEGKKGKVKRGGKRSFHIFWKVEALRCGSAKQVLRASESCSECGTLTRIIPRLRNKLCL